MVKSVALRGRAKLAALPSSLSHRSAPGSERKEPDPRNVMTWRQFLLGVIVQRSTRLMTVAQAVAPWRKVGSVKSAAMALGYFLEKARFPMRSYATRLVETAVLTLGSGQLESYRGKVLLVIDPTEYAKRSRGRGKRRRWMQHIGRVRKTQTKAKKIRKEAGSYREERHGPAPEGRHHLRLRGHLGRSGADGQADPAPGPATVLQQPREAEESEPGGGGGAVSGVRGVEAGRV